MVDDMPTRQLLQGDLVEIRRDGQIVRVGRIDALLPGSGILWLRQDGNEGRRIYDPADGYEVRPFTADQNQTSVSVTADN